MSNAIQAAAAWVTNAIATALSIEAGSFLYQAIYYGTEAALYYGTSQLLSEVGRPDLPGTDLASVSVKQAIPERTRGYGRYRTSGPYMLYAAKHGISYDVFALLDGKVSAISKYYLNDNEVTLVSNQVQSPGDRVYGNSSDLVWIYTRLGTIPETNYSEITTALSSLWPSTARLDGVASLYLKCKMGKPEKFTSDYPDGLPIASVELEAQYVYDWRLDSTRDGGSGSQRVDDESTWAWSDNNALIAAHYLMQEVGLDFEQVIAPNLSYWTTAADICDETVTLPDSSTQKRYTCGGGYYASNGPATVLGAILTACGGYLAEDGRGGLILYAGKWYDPVVTIDDTLDLIESYYFERGREGEEAYNAFDVSYTNPVERYNKGDAGRWINDDAVTDAGGIIRATTLDLQWVQNHWQAQRCAKIYDRKANARLTGYIIGGLSLIQAYGEMVINLNITDCPALTGVTVMPTKIEIMDLMAGRVKVSFLELTEEAFSFDDSEYIPIDSSAFGGTGSNTVDDPNIDSYDVAYDETSPGVFSPRVTLHLDQTYRDDVNYQIRYRTSVSDSWVESTTITPTNDTHADVQTGYLPGSATVYIQVRALFGSGGITDWGTQETLDLSGAYAAPAPPTSPTASYSTPDLTVSWTASAGPNLAGYRVFTTTTSVFASATDISGLITTTSHVESGLAAGTYYVWVRAEGDLGATSDPVPTSPASITI